MRGQAGFWDIDERYVRLSEAGDPLEKLNALCDPAWNKDPVSGVIGIQKGL